MCAVVPRSPCGGTSPVPRGPPWASLARKHPGDVFAKGLPDHVRSLVALMIWRNIAGVAFRPGRRGSPWTHPARGFQFPLQPLTKER